MVFVKSLQQCTTAHLVDNVMIFVGLKRTATVFLHQVNTLLKAH